VLFGTAAIGGAVLLLLFWLVGDFLPVIGNILSPFGIGPLTLADTYIQGRNLPSAVPLLWQAATVWGAFATGFVLTVIGGSLLRMAGTVWRGRTLRPAWPHGLMLAMMAVYATGLFIIGYQAFWFDRYLLLFIPPALGLLMLACGGAAPRGITAPSVVLTLYAIFAVLGTHDYLAWNRARWQALGSLEQQGVSPRQIDGGYEYDGWLLYDPQYKATKGKSYWWVVDDEYMIASGPVPGYQPVGSFPYDRWLVPSRPAVLALKRER
jgi:hypothetical protein